MSAVVIAAKVPWKATNTYSGIVASAEESVSGLVPARRSLSNPPKKVPSPVKASEKPYATQRIEISENTTNTCISTESVFFERARPP
ncbi:hypothetical protein D3C83_106780 [compost metagenome]